MISASISNAPRALLAAGVIPAGTVANLIDSTGAVVDIVRSDSAEPGSMSFTAPAAGGVFTVNVSRVDINGAVIGGATSSPFTVPAAASTLGAVTVPVSVSVTVSP